MANIRFPARKEALSSSSPEQSYHRSRRVRRKDLGIDYKVIQAAFSWLDVSQTETEAERRQHINHVSDLLNLVLSSLQSADDEGDDEIDGIPNGFDGWVFGHVARTIVQMRDDEQPLSMWEPILTLGSHAHDWIERFFWDWFSVGFHASPDHGTFLRRWMEMVNFALTSPQWDTQNVRESDLDDMVFELMGYHFGLHSIAAESEFATVLEEMVPMYETAALHWFSMPRVANGFARSLSEPGYDRILCPGIRWLHQAIPGTKENRFWHEHELVSNLISALHRCWDTHREAVCADRDLQTAFLGLLTVLASRGSHAAMALRERLLDSIPSSE